MIYFLVFFSISVKKRNDRKKEIKIKRGKKYGDLPDLLSIGPKGPLSTGNLQASTYRFIVSVTENKNKYNGE